MKNLKKAVLALLFCLFIVVFNSCLTHQQLLLYPESTGSSQSLYPTIEYKIKPFDLLSINSYALSPQSTYMDYINRRIVGQPIPQAIGQSILYMQGLIVSPDGYIDVASIGKVKAAGMTIRQLQDTLTSRIKEQDSTAYFIVKLINYRISILGEVRSPGVHYFYEEKVTLMQALSQAGGLTEVSNVKRVKLTRETENGIISTYLDLSNPNVVSSEFYFLQNQDVIFVEPLKIKAFRINSQSLTLTLSALSLVLAFYSLYRR